MQQVQSLQEPVT